LGRLTELSTADTEKVLIKAIELNEKLGVYLENLDKYKANLDQSTTSFWEAEVTTAPNPNADKIQNINNIKELLTTAKNVVSNIKQELQA